MRNGVKEINNEKSIYTCDACNVKCSHLSVYNRHIKTLRHLKMTECKPLSYKIQENQHLCTFIVEQTKQYAETINSIVQGNAEVINQIMMSTCVTKQG